MSRVEGAGRGAEDLPRPLITMAAVLHAAVTGDLTRALGGTRAVCRKVEEEEEATGVF